MTTTTDRDQLREALEPFALMDHEPPVVDDNGWTAYGVSWCKERIVDWFGPSDFRRALAALATPTALDPATIEHCAKIATSFLVGDPKNGVPLRNPMAHEIAAAIRASVETRP